MKNNLLLVACLVSFCCAKAQFNKGQKLIGGQFTFSSSNVDISAPGNSQKGTDIGISPSFSTFTSPTAIQTLGFSYNYHHFRTSIGSPNNEQNINTHTFGFFADRTKLEALAKRFYFTYNGSVNVQYTFGKSTFILPGNGTESNGILMSAGAGIGLLYQMNQRFLLTCGLNNLFSVYYSHVVTKSTGSVNYKTDANNVGLTTGLTNLSLSSLSIGVKYMLKK